MRRIATLACWLALAGAVLAGGPDDDYIAIYSQIQQAEALQKGGQMREAAAAYLHARDALEKLHADFPASNTAAVAYRLDYLAEKLKELASYLPSGNAASAAPKPATPLTPQQQAAMWQEEISALTNSNAELEIKVHAAQQQINALQQKINQLSNDYARSDMKLKEALSVQPAAVAPDELAKARQQILALQKERDLLRVTVEQQKAPRPGPKPSAANTESAKPPAEIADIRYNLSGMPAQQVLNEIYAPLVNRTQIQAGEGPNAIPKTLMIALRTPSNLTKSAAIKLLETVMATNGITIVPVGDNFFTAVLNKVEPAAPVERPLPDNLKQLSAERDKLKSDLAAAKRDLESANRKVDANSADATAKLKAAEKDKDDLKKALDLANRKVEANSADAAAKLKGVEKERDDLKKQIAAMKPAPAPPRAAATASGSSAEVAGLRARLAVLEAAKVPYTAEELAVMKGSPAAAAPAPPVAAKAPSAKVHTLRDLTQNLTDIMRQAKIDAESQHYADAEKKYQDVLRQDENNVDVMYFLGHLQFVAGHPDDCDKTVHRALALSPNDPGNLYLLGILRFGQNKLDDALDALSRSAAVNATNSATQFSLGSVLAAKGLRTEAETAFRRAVQVDPAYADAHFNLALIYA
ncbi:MAG: tetratricopeptide repeat protein, partial [Verrucomicrobiota bacterium]